MLAALFDQEMVIIGFPFLKTFFPLLLLSVFIIYVFIYLLVLV